HATVGREERSQVRLAVLGAPEVDLLRIGVGVVLEEDLARADWDVRASPIQLEDTSPLHLEHRVAERAVVAAREEGEVRHGVHGVGCRRGRAVAERERCGHVTRELLEGLTLDLVAYVVDSPKQLCPAVFVDRWEIGERVAVQPKPLPPLFGLCQTFRVLRMDMLERPRLATVNAERIALARALYPTDRFDVHQE